jgi:cobalamin biosynthesis Mg chelatase CobN
MLCTTLHQDKKRLEGRMVWLKCPACRGLISDQAVESFAAHFSGLPEAAADMSVDTTEQYAASPERSSSDKHSVAAAATTAAATADADNSDGYNRFDTGATDMVISPMAAAAGSSSARRRKRTSTLNYEESASKVAAADSTALCVCVVLIVAECRWLLSFVASYCR